MAGFPTTTQTLKFNGRVTQNTAGTVIYSKSTLDKRKGDKDIGVTIIPETVFVPLGSPRVTARGGFCLNGGLMPRRVCFLVDGFNVYHSLVEAQKELSAPMKWLDVGALCRSFLSSIGRDAVFERIFYFSAPPDHFPSKNVRHGIYMHALRESGVTVQLGRFKNKTVKCPKCTGIFTRHEEKETDVAIAVKLLELFHVNACDLAVIVTGDTDIAPAIRTAQTLWPSKEVMVAFPFKRHNAELKGLVTLSLNIKPKVYARFQLPDPVVAANGTLIAKPPSW